MVANEEVPPGAVTDYAVPPGEALLDELDARGMSQAELSERTGLSRKTVNEIVKGKAPVTPETALQLERVLGIPARLWNSLERNYRQDKARLEERARLEKKTGWLKSFPVHDMVTNGWLPKTKDRVECLRALLNFLAVSSPAEWENLKSSRLAAAYRKSNAYGMDWNAVAVWLRVGETRARDVSCAPFSEAGFREVLRKARGLTRESVGVFNDKLAAICARAGVALVLVKELPGTRLSGATRWLSPEKAVIQLSLRYKTADQLWFTFFHEAGHILRHNKTAVFLEKASGEEREEDEEREADKFASDFLLPQKYYRRFVSGTRAYSYDAVRRFADEMGIAPDIVVGRLQHDGYLPYTHLNSLRRKVVWA